MKVVSRIGRTAISLLLILIALIAGLSWSGFVKEEIVFGATFSQTQASGIGLDWREAYRAMLDELRVRQLRLMTYWQVIEPANNQFDWSTIDWQMDEAAKRGAEVILTVGRKQPRWPECHEPEWVKGKSETAKQAEILVMVKAVVERYRTHPALAKWQLENEPWLDFGNCPPVDPVFFQLEEQKIRSLDPAHPILVTDSGELNWWWTASGYGDELGTTMYRTVWSEKTDRHFSYDYIFPAGLYRLKSWYIEWLRDKDVLVAELQGEPWGSESFTEMTVADRRDLMSPERLGELANFARRAQISPAYWWGVEYWYWEKEQGDDSYWKLAKEFFK